MYSHLWHDSFLHVTRSRIRSKWALSRSLQSPPKHPTHPRPPHPTTSSAPDHRQAHLCAHSIALFLTSDELHHTSASHTHSAARALGSPSVAAVNRTRACAVEVSDYEPPTPSLSTPAHKSRAVAPQLPTPSAAPAGPPPQDVSGKAAQATVARVVRQWR
jgi:hypothetical protein